MSDDFELVPSPEKEDRNWLPLIVAVVIVLVVATGTILSLQHGQNRSGVAPVDAPLDPYAGNLMLSHPVMSESGNLAGGKMTYVDGHIVNQGNRTITGITVQVLFRNFAKEVAQNESQPLRLIRVREPYVDVEPISAVPLAPGDEKDFRLIFDRVSPDWNGALPEIRILRVETK